jgi:hypothetical protein
MKYLPKTGICHQEVRTDPPIFLKPITYGYGGTLGTRALVGP